MGNGTQLGWRDHKIGILNREERQSQRERERETESERQRERHRESQRDRDRETERREKERERVMPVVDGGVMTDGARLTDCLSVKSRRINCSVTSNCQYFRARLVQGWVTTV